MYMVDDHPSFANKPAVDADVWRYMDLARFLSLLEDSALTFSRGDVMRDKWEGSFSVVNQMIRPQLYGVHFEEMFAPGRPEQHRESALKSIHMNCWYVAHEESAAMWDIYQREGRGVAIRSTWGALTSSLDTERMVYGGLVQYVDYSQTFIPEGNMFDAFMHKRLSFAHEREARLVFLSGYSAPHPTEPNTAINLGPEPSALHVKVDLDQLVGAVYVAPDAPAWISDLVAKIVVSYGRKFPVVQSDLARDPIA